MSPYPSRFISATAGRTPSVLVAALAKKSLPTFVGLCPARKERPFQTAVRGPPPLPAPTTTSGTPSPLTSPTATAVPPYQFGSVIPENFTVGVGVCPGRSADSVRPE